MPDNLIRAIIVLAVPLLIVYAIVIGTAHALIVAYREVVTAWRDPQSTRFTDWRFWH